MKLRSKDGPQGRTWIARQWLKLLDASFSADVLREGLAYARSGQTVGFEIKPGLIEAQVQGRAAKPYAMALRVQTLSAGQWERLIDVMAAEAVYVARLLANELPPSIQQAFASMGLEIMPRGPEAVVCECQCAAEGLCKHAATVAYLVAEQLDDDPMTSFTLRGIPGEQLLDRLRQARTIHTHGVAAAHADPMIPESRAPVPPLEECIDDFWRLGHRLAELRESHPPPHVHHALLRRLGPSPMNGKFPLVGMLASVYDCVAESAVRLRDQADQLEENGE
ncbi:MAG: hypothetical protein JSV91_13175 [Phycisphaerales bacterium]|nr:MAG: hypothetical protein JSV91_13175 [Phycisphaerales bacterium]